jgi:hypothetical protein
MGLQRPNAGLHTAATLIRPSLIGSTRESDDPEAHLNTKKAVGRSLSWHRVIAKSERSGVLKNIQRLIAVMRIHEECVCLEDHILDLTLVCVAI